MNKNLKITRLMLMCILSLIIISSSCKKDSNNYPASKTDLLSEGIWKISALTVDPGFPTFDENFNITGYSNDVYAMMDDCSKDDTFKFNTDKSMISDEGGSKCDSSNVQSTTGSWNLNTDETVLSITLDGDSQNLTIMELSNSVLKVKYNETDGSDTYTYTITFKH